MSSVVSILNGFGTGDGDGRSGHGGFSGSFGRMPGRGRGSLGGLGSLGDDGRDRAGDAGEHGVDRGRWSGPGDHGTDHSPAHSPDGEARHGGGGVPRLAIAALLGACALAAGAAPAAAQGLTPAQQQRLGVPPTVLPPATIVIRQPLPVIIVGDTQAAEEGYRTLETRLSQLGYTVQFFPLPQSGKVDIGVGATQLDRLVTELRTATGAAKVHLIGHTQGAIAARTYIKRFTGEAKVESLISLAGPHQGTEAVRGARNQYPAPTALGCFLGNPAPLPSPNPCEQMAPGAALLQEINNRPANDPIFYTNVATRDDEWIVPDTNALMANNCNRKSAAGENLDCNILIQRFCPDYQVSHAALPSDNKVFSLIKRALVHLPVDLGCGPVVDAPADIECETAEAKFPATGLGSNPRAVVRVPLGKLQQGFVRVGGGCEVSRAGRDSVHAEVMVQSMPDGTDGWACKGADPANIPNPAWARATINYCRTKPSGLTPSMKLSCTTASQRSALGRYPLATVELAPALVSAGYSVVSGGCESSHAGNGSIHAENIVASSRTPSSTGWQCQAADPPNIGQDATVTALLVACRVELSSVDQARFPQRQPVLACNKNRVGFSPVQTYPQSLAHPMPTDRIFGGECLLTYGLGHGSVHAEFMVESGFHGLETWACFGADPPGIPNPGTAQAGAIGCSIQPGR